MDTTTNKEVIDAFSKGFDAAPNPDDAQSLAREQLAGQAAARFYLEGDFDYLSHGDPSASLARQRFSAERKGLMRSPQACNGR